ncbi:conserved hypothetical protein [Ricinus communis]|uniref:Uncharacterized protein n=1 Tax=Ricinus communis TaxID=3988 RepID=B9SKA3_RICCO|nr:conserved hypothetical protein [Ricinus communis]
MKISRSTGSNTKSFPITHNSLMPRCINIELIAICRKRLPKSWTNLTNMNNLSLPHGPVEVIRKTFSLSKTRASPHTSLHENLTPLTCGRGINKIAL